MTDDGFCEVSFEGASDDAEPVQFYDDKRVKGRKDYQCCECSETILKGESHTRISYRYDGKFSVDRLCDPCQEAKAEFEYRIIGGFFWDNMREEWAQGAHITACINRLTTAKAKERMQQQWLKWQESQRQKNRGTNV